VLACPRTKQRESVGKPARVKRIKNTKSVLEVPIGSQERSIKSMSGPRVQYQALAGLSKEKAKGVAAKSENPRVSQKHSSKSVLESPRDPR
jgi:hypothetical protein